MRKPVFVWDAFVRLFHWSLVACVLLNLWVVDDGTTDSGGSARSAGVRAYSTMSDIDTGSDVAPTTIANTNGACWVKSRKSCGMKVSTR